MTNRNVSRNVKKILVLKRSKLTQKNFKRTKEVISGCISQT